MKYPNAKPLPPFIRELRGAIRRGDKTQTRRVLIPQPTREPFRISNGIYSTGPKSIWRARYRVGDICYLREPLTCAGCPIAHYADDNKPVMVNRATVEWDWKVSKLSQLYMPRFAARTFVQITHVVIEHVQDITEADAIAEGIAPLRGGFFDAPLPIGRDDSPYCSARAAFTALWNHINAKRGFASTKKKNPWVWVYVFKKL